MKFEFQKIGPVNKAELGLGDLTIIAGRNNTGKTYLAYTLYGFLKVWEEWPNAEKFLGGQDTRNKLEFLDFEEIAKELMAGETVRRPKDRKSLQNERQEAALNLGRDFSKGRLSRVFSSPRSEFLDASITVDFDTEFPGSVPVMQLQLSPRGVLSIEYDGKDVVIQKDKLESSTRKSSVSRISNALSYLYFHFLFCEFPEPFILSAERFGISLFYKDLDLAKSRIVEFLQNKEDIKEFSRFSLVEKIASRYSLPIRDNIDYTRDISDLRREKSQIFESKLTNNIREMMAGYYRSTGEDIRFISRTRGDHSFDIPLHIASSSARGLSDLYFFLRHAAKKNHLLIIDEPESHLDTGNQILMARLISHIVRAGLKVLITTHSDYLVKEINNLIMLSHPFENKEKIVKGLGYTSKDFLPKEKVRAYVAENGGLTTCRIDEIGIDMPTFDFTIDKINYVSRELASRIKLSNDKE